MTIFFNEPLIDSLLEAEEDLKTIKEVKYCYNSTLKHELQKLNLLDAKHPNIKEFYNEIADGFQLNWKKDANSFGFIQLAEMKHLLLGANGNGIYINEDLPQDADIRFFHPFDFPTPETYVGFIIKPEAIYKSVYYLHGDNELSNLDLDFHSYTEMAFEARIFNYWQRVLLEYMNRSSSEITKTFQTVMLQIFPDWTWENFIEKFESLRINKSI